MRLRARSIKGVKVNNKRSFTYLHCRYCKEGCQETQEHLEECLGCNFERRGLDLSRWEGRVMFWRRMIAKLVATVALGHVALPPLCDSIIPVDDTLNNKQYRSYQAEPIQVVDCWKHDGKFVIYEY